MKNLIITMFFMLSITSSYGQEFEFIKLSDAYNYAVSSGSFGTYDFTGATAVGNSGDQTTFNLDNGTAVLWSLTGKPKDGSSTLGLTITIYKTAGTFFSQRYEVQGDYSGFPVVNNDFADSDALAVQIKNSQEFQTYYNSNTDTLTYISFNLGFSFSDINQMVWTTSIFNSNQSDMLICFWDYKTLAKIQCSSISGVEEKEFVNFDVYPNPSTDIISFEIPYSGFANYFIYDNLGDIVNTSSMNIDNNANINVGALNNGVYNLVVIAGKNVFSKQIIKIK